MAHHPQIPILTMDPSTLTLWRQFKGSMVSRSTLFLPTRWVPILLSSCTIAWPHLRIHSQHRLTDPLIHRHSSTTTSNGEWRKSCTKIGDLKAGHITTETLNTWCNGRYMIASKDYALMNGIYDWPSQMDDCFDMSACPINKNPLAGHVWARGREPFRSFPNTSHAHLGEHETRRKARIHSGSQPGATSPAGDRSQLHINTQMHSIFSEYFQYPFKYFQVHRTHTPWLTSVYYSISRSQAPTIPVSNTEAPQTPCIWGYGIRWDVCPCILTYHRVT